jgi:hypothetical protein
VLPRRRGGISPVIATTILLAIAVAVGAALWGFTSSATGATLQEQADKSAGSINQLNEKFIIFNLNVTLAPGANNVTIWFYNNGNIATNITGVLIWEGEDRADLQEFTDLSAQIQSGKVASLTLTYSVGGAFESGKTYYVQAVGLYGNTYTYFQKVGT